MTGSQRNWKQFLSAHDRGFLGLQIVQPDYEISDGLLRPVYPPLERMLAAPDQAAPGDSWRYWQELGVSYYSPASEDAANLPAAFAKISEPDHESLLKFAREWGGLGYVELGMRADKLGIPVDFESFRAPSGELDGDPVLWVWAHARTVRFLLELIDVLRSPDDTGTGTGGTGASSLLVNQMPDESSGEWEFTFAVLRNPRAPVIVPKDSGVVPPGWSVTAAVVSANIEWLRSELMATVWGDRDNPGGLQLGYDWSGLIEMIYWRVGELASRSKEQGEGVLKRCKECGHFFVAKNPKQVYCPPSVGLARSLCGGRRRTRRWREGRRREELEKPTRSSEVIQ